MENVWHMMSEMVYEYQQYANTEDLWRAIKISADRLSGEKLP